MDISKLLTKPFEPHPASPGATRYTNAVLRNQNNEAVKFYDDLIRGKQVVVNFMYAECHGSCPAVAGSWTVTTCTGISSIKGVKRPLFRNPLIKPPSFSLSMILGAIPPAT